MIHLYSSELSMESLTIIFNKSSLKLVCYTYELEKKTNIKLALDIYICIFYCYDKYSCFFVASCKCISKFVP